MDVIIKRKINKIMKKCIIVKIQQNHEIKKYETNILVSNVTEECDLRRC